MKPDKTEDKQERYAATGLIGCAVLYLVIVAGVIALLRWLAFYLLG